MKYVSFELLIFKGAVNEQKVDTTITLRYDYSRDLRVHSSRKTTRKITLHEITGYNPFPFFQYGYQKLGIETNRKWVIKKMENIGFHLCDTQHLNFNMEEN